MISCPHCHETVIGEPERIAAKDIVVKLMKTFARSDISRMLKINEVYISYAAGMTMRGTDKYFCPEQAIISILEWAQRHG